MELVRRSIKLTSFAWLTVIYFTIAFAATMLADAFTKPIDRRKSDETPVWKLFFTILVYMWYLAAVAYAARIITARIPFPLDGVAGFVYSDTRELLSFPLFAGMLITFSRNLRDKASYLFWRVGGRRGKLSLSNDVN